MTLILIHRITVILIDDYSLMSVNLKKSIAQSTQTVIKPFNQDKKYFTIKILILNSK